MATSFVINEPTCSCNGRPVEACEKVNECSQDCPAKHFVGNQQRPGPTAEQEKRFSPFGDPLSYLDAKTGDVKDPSKPTTTPGEESFGAFGLPGESGYLEDEK